MSRLSKHHFWEWFGRHHQEYFALKNKSKKEATYWLNELNAHLRAYFKFFSFSFVWKQEQTVTLTITVNGKAMHFKKVEALVAKAPEIPGWKFVALENPKPIDCFLEEQMELTGVDPRELSFCFGHDGPNGVRLIIYHPLCTPENDHLIYQLANSAVYNLLGERSFGTDISGIHVANLSTADPDDLEELEALPHRIGSRMSSLVVDSRGKLEGIN